MLARPEATDAENVRCVGFVELLPEIVAAVERDDHLEVGQALLDLGAQRAERLQALDVAPLHPRPGDACHEQHAERRSERRHAETHIEGEQKDRGAGHHEQVGRELHEALREELVQLVGVVVDSRDQVAGLVLVEEVERQLLQLREERVAQGEQHPPADAAHRLRLDVGRDERRQVDEEEQSRRAQHAAEVAGRGCSVSTVCAMMSGPTSPASDEMTTATKAIDTLFRSVAMSGRSRRERRGDSRRVCSGRRTTECVRLRIGWCCVGSHRSARIPARSAAVSRACRPPGLRLPSAG